MKDFINHFLSEEITEPYSDEWEAKRRVGDAIRNLTEVLVTSSPDIANMHLIAAELEKTAEQCGRAPRIYGRMKWAESGDHGNFFQINHELNPVSGQSNSIAPPLKYSIEGNRAYGNCHCGWAYEGPPGGVHGGYIAAIFDEFLGTSQILGTVIGLTANLDVSYHAPTPLNTDLALEGWIEKAEERKTLLVGELRAGGALTASCRALFVQPRTLSDMLSQATES